MSANSFFTFPTLRFFLSASLSCGAASAYADGEAALKSSPASNPTVNSSDAAKVKEITNNSDFIKKLTYTQYRDAKARPHLGAPREGDIFVFTGNLGEELVDADNHVLMDIEDAKKLDPHEIQKGRAQLWENQVRVLQIIGEDSMLVSVVSRSKFLLDYNKPPYFEKTFTAYVCGVKTKGLYDGDRFSAAAVFACKGPYTYKTAQGATNTLPLIVLVTEPAPTVAEKADEEAAAKRKADNAPEAVAQRAAAIKSKEEKDEVEAGRRAESARQEAESKKAAEKAAEEAAAKAAYNSPGAVAKRAARLKALLDAGKAQ